MKALRISEPGKTVLAEIDKPAFAPDEVLLRIRRIGMCGTDLSTYLGKNPLVSYPRIPGHEIAATVETVGGEVPDSFSVGAAVTVVPYTNCGRCSSCRRGRPNACRFNETLGVQRDGAMTELVPVPWRKLVAVPGLGVDRLAFVEPLTIGFHAVERGAVTDSDTVLVIGSGMIGLGAIVRATLRGARVIAADIDPGKLGTAAAFGATLTVNSAGQDLHSFLAEHTGGDGPDVVIEAVGNPATYRTAVEEVAFSGRVVCIGYAAADASLPTRLFVQKELDVRGSRNATAMDFAAVGRLLASEKLPIERVVSATVGLDSAGEALATWSRAPEKMTKILVEL